MKRAMLSIRAGLAAIALALFAIGAAPALAQPSPTGSNPTANSVNEEMLFKQSPKIGGRITIPDDKAANLIQPQGRDWRGFHEGALPWIGGIAILGMVLALGAFYFTKGRIRMEDSPESGTKIVRFNAFERFAHWLTSTTFIILAISGLNYIFGKYLLLPIIGPSAFASFSQWSKYAHNYLAWPFMLGIVFLIAVWLKDNIPNRVDVAWLKAGGGFFGSGKHPHAERFNAGQKLVFWIVVIGGVAMSVSGVIMLFPFSATDINGMQLSSIVHSVIGLLFIAAMLGHIYIGSLGMEGAYDAMGSGKVDLAWARRHHDLWVEKEQAKNASGPQLKGGHPAPAE